MATPPWVRCQATPNICVSYWWHRFLEERSSWSLIRENSSFSGGASGCLTYAPHIAADTSQLTPWSRVLLVRLRNSPPYRTRMFIIVFIRARRILPRPSHPIFLRFILILSLHLHLPAQACQEFSSVLLSYMKYAFLVCPTSAICFILICSRYVYFCDECN
jgi:hypothetical protein